ncbi:hypothetical protein QFC20_003719 [Naganishia adeliensis]|uniref:Uncharacterized protein n=1 Tax=Naganishia adeliensis TaxID=92952 RepID=A0ACC2W996_9TREE|nr:hypothetical protein QFC20_003719 [Naganishia adeliensis]
MSSKDVVAQMQKEHDSLVKDCKKFDLAPSKSLFTARRLNARYKALGAILFAAGENWILSDHREERQILTKEMSTMEMFYLPPDEEEPQDTEAKALGLGLRPESDISEGQPLAAQTHSSAAALSAITSVNGKGTAFKEGN